MTGVNGVGGALWRMLSGGTWWNGMLNKSIEFSLYATKAFQEDDETKDSKARADEHASGGNAPSWRKEACVNGVPVPEHL